MWKKQSTWILLVSAVLLVSLGALALLRLAGGGSVARITVDGKEIKRIDLSTVAEAYEFDVEGENGKNRVRVEPGRIGVISADCPDGVCVAHGMIEKSGDPVICLPHRLVIEIVGADGGPDAVIGEPHE